MKKLLIDVMKIVQNAKLNGQLIVLNVQNVKSQNHLFIWGIVMRIVHPDFIQMIIFITYVNVLIKNANYVLKIVWKMVYVYHAMMIIIQRTMIKK